MRRGCLASTKKPDFARPEAEPTPRRRRESVVSMKMKWHVPAMFLGAALMCVPASAWSQQSDTTPAQTQDNGSQAKQDMRNAGHETKDAARDAGNGTKHGTKKAYHSTKRGTKKAWNKTKSTTKGAANGAKEGAQQPQ
jgi:hypothetical protein